MVTVKHSQCKGPCLNPRSKNRDFHQSNLWRDIPELYSVLVRLSLCIKKKDFTVMFRDHLPNNEDFENIAGKGENAGYQHFLLFTQCLLLYERQI